jgi:two-component system LytT family response regulator
MLIRGECSDGMTAVQLIQKLAPELIFMDIQMPGMDGFGVINSVGISLMPFVVFVTAYEQYALEAFGVHALDYLLKPWESQRFQAMLQRVRQVIRMKRQSEQDKQMEHLLRQVQSGQQMLAQALEKMEGNGRSRYLERLVVKSNGRITFLKVEDIDQIKAAGDYLELRHTGGTTLLRGKIGSMERKLDPCRFVRVHRSNIVNIERIREIHPLFHKDSVIILRDKAEVPVSRNYRARLDSALSRGR